MILPFAQRTIALLSWIGGGAWAAFTVLLLTGWIGLQLRTNLGRVVDTGLGVMVGCLGIGAGALIAGILLQWLRSPLWLELALVSGAFLMLSLTLKGLAQFPLLLALGVAFAVCQLQALVGATVLAWVQGGVWAAGPAEKAGLAALAALFLVLEVGAAAWLFGPGEQERPEQSATSKAQAVNWTPVRNISIEHLTYGTGTDKRRPEYGPRASVLTRTVDGSPILTGWNGLRQRIWGFGPQQLPLNGRVWAPVAAGSYPLVLIAHGNHQAEVNSDAGYQYLGQALASQGYVVVSIDQNFLNSSWYGGLGNDNAGRAWLLLEHLNLWREWAAAGDHPLGRRVDLSRIALIGHSRGGEAVALAALFNRLSHFPDDARLQFEYQFDLRSLVAIAPSDGQYKPAGHPVRLQDVSYLTIQGSHDADYFGAFPGLAQYQRVRFQAGGSAAKAAVLLHRANHSQFNSEWGRLDMLPPKGWLLNRRAIVPGKLQREAAQLLISHFLHETLAEQHQGLDVFEQAQRGAELLPGLAYTTQFGGACTTLVADFEEDADPTTGSVQGVKLRGTDLSTWREEALRFRTGTQAGTHAVRLGWVVGGSPHYEIRLPAGFAERLSLRDSGQLLFSLGFAGASVGDAPEISIEIEDEEGRVQRTRLDQHAHPRQIPPARLTKLGRLEARFFSRQEDVVLQTYALSLRAFSGTVGSLDLSRLRVVRLRFDHNRNGEVLLDDVAFRPC